MTFRVRLWPLGADSSRLTIFKLVVGEDARSVSRLRGLMPHGTVTHAESLHRVFPAWVGDGDISEPVGARLKDKVVSEF